MRIIKSLIRALPVFSVLFMARIGDAFAQTTGGGPAIKVDEYTYGNFSTIFERMADSFVGTPGLISAAAYLTAMIMAVAAVLKLKEVFDNPGQTSMREVIGRALIAGALFAMPTVIDVATATIGSQDGNVAVRELAFDPASLASGAVTTAVGGGSYCDGLRATRVTNSVLSGGAGGGITNAITNGITSYLSGGTIGEAICYTTESFSGVSELLGTILYISGLFLVFWGLLQMRDHIVSPDRAPVSAPLKKLLIAGAFFAFPSVIEVVQNSVAGGGGEMGLVSVDPSATLACATGGTGGLLDTISNILTIFSGDGGGGGTATGSGLDCMMIRLVTDLWMPVQIAVSVFCYLAGIIIIALALRRMLDNMDKGARSPVGIGTLTMFGVGGALLSFDLIIRAVSVSIFPDGFSTAGAASLKLYGALAYAPGVSASGVQSINSVITVVFMFSFLVGIISIVRGLFILKEVSNGGNASLMAGFTHVLGGGLAVNLGPVVGAVQNTLGLSDIGIKISSTPFGI